MWETGQGSVDTGLAPSTAVFRLPGSCLKLCGVHLTQGLYCCAMLHDNKGFDQRGLERSETDRVTGSCTASTDMRDWENLVVSKVPDTLLIFQNILASYSVKTSLPVVEDICGDSDICTFLLQANWK